MRISVMVVDQKTRDALDLRRLNLPPYPVVKSLEAEEYYDWAGDESLWIWCVIPDDTVAENITGGAVMQIKREIHDSLIAQGIDLFPYIHFVKESERHLTVDDEA